MSETVKPGASEQPAHSELDPEQFAAYEAVILTGQMPAEAVPKFLQDNPAFAAWYRARRR